MRATVWQWFCVCVDVCGCGCGCGCVNRPLMRSNFQLVTFVSNIDINCLTLYPPLNTDALNLERSKQTYWSIDEIAWRDQVIESVCVYKQAFNAFQVAVTYFCERQWQLFSIKYQPVIQNLKEFGKVKINLLMYRWNCITRQLKVCV